MRDQKRELPLKDPQAFGQLYEFAHLAVFRFIYRLLGGPRQAVEDLTAETFTRAWKARHRFRGDRQAAIAWLLTIARRLVIDAHRKQKRANLEVQLDEQSQQSPNASPEDVLVHQEQQETLTRLLQALPLKQREMLILRYALGWRVKDIAAHLGLRENTASVILRRSLAKLRQEWPTPEATDSEVQNAIRT